jgi:hypothetical protein
MSTVHTIPERFISLTFISGLIFLSAACNTGNKPGSDKASTPAVAETTPAPVAFDPDPTDTIPGDAYPSYGSDTAAAALIRSTIQTAEKDMLSSIPEEQRKFKYHAVDLDKDGRNEYMVALYTPMYCGTGGCSAYLLNADGSMNSRFTVVEFPIYVAATATEGWQDLIMYSGRENRLVKRKGGKYPSNPSTLPVYRDALPDASSMLLNIWEGGPYPSFSF